MKPHPLQQLGPIARRGLIGCLLAFAVLAAEPGLFAQQGNQSRKAGKAPPNRRFSKEPPGGSVMDKPKEFFRKIHGPVQPGQLYVKFRDGTTPQQKQAAHAAARMSRVEHSFEALLPHTVRVAIPPGRELESVNAYLDDPNVVYAEPVYLYQLQSNVPNDPDWPVLWGMHRINAHHAWDVSTGDPNFTIGIVDSGLYASHLDLGGNVWVNPGEIPNNRVDDDQNGKVDDINGWHFGWNWDDMVDIGGSHGTHVAGTIGAIGNNSRRGVGVNWNCKLLMAGCGIPGSQGEITNVLEGFQYILTNRIVRVSNHSYRSTNYSATQFNLFQAAQGMGHIAVCAAGNDAFDNDTSKMRAFPASYPLDNIISVAASSLLDDLAVFSNYGATNVDLAAPGFSILSTVGVFPDGTEYKDGTSMASPHVAGAIGLIWSTRTNLTWWQIRERILTGVKPVLGLATTVHSGGRLDVARSMAVFCEKGAGTGAGFLSDPYRDFDQALGQVPSYGQLYVRSSYAWTGRIGDSPMRIAAHGGPVRIGQSPP